MEDLATGFGAEAWTPAWVVLVMLGGLLVVVVGGIASAVLIGLWSGRSRRRADGDRAPDQR